MKKAFFTLALTLVAFTGNAQSNLDGDMNHDGEKNITDVMLLVDEILNGSKPQSYLTCPDDHHPHMIDLGLPSGTKWACCNVGADKPEAYGGYYAWGETEEKERYDEESYSFFEWDYSVDFDQEIIIYTDLGDDIAGTEYDVAHVKWGCSWVMPSEGQIEELLDNCSCAYISKNGVKGGQFTGTNGGSVFLPAAGNRGDGVVYTTYPYGRYWSSTQNPSDPSDWYVAYSLTFASTSFSWIRNHYIYYGLTVRPVSR